jgi:antirestriction protein ArdC
MTSTLNRADVYEQITDTIVSALSAGNVPWHKPWRSVSGLPKSLSTGKAYRGINVLLLGMATMENGYASPWWGTYKKIQERGGQVRKGESSTLVTFWSRYTKDVTNDTTGERERQNRFVLRVYRVFNSEQAEWEEGKAPVFDIRPVSGPERIANAEAIMAGYKNGPVIRHGGEAWYRPDVDVLNVPALEQFEDVNEYYSTLFHEATHSTGHKSRLAREGATGQTHFGDERYSKEELVAEFGSAMLCALAGIDQTKTLPNSAAYIAGWLSALQNDRRLIVNAAAQAQRAADHITGVTFGDQDESKEEN